MGRPAGPGAPGVQDLLLATARSLLGLPLGLAHTDPHDFLANEYGGAGFEAEGLGPVRLRALCAGRSPQGPDRYARLAAAVARGHARLGLELRLEGSRDWLRLVDVELREAADLDERALRFSPFRAEAGLRPAGFWQAMRVGPYRVAQTARGACVPAEEASPARGRRHARTFLPRRLRRAAARAPFRRGQRG